MYFEPAEGLSYRLFTVLLQLLGEGEIDFGLTKRRRLGLLEDMNYIYLLLTP